MNLRAINRHWLVALASVVFIITTGYQVFSREIGAVPDEAYHYRAIQMQAEQWGPVIQNQADFAATGDLTRNPSFLYHYLFSFPYRLLFYAGLSDTAIQNVIGLMTLGLGIVSIMILYRLLGRLTTNRIAQQVTAIYALLPITTIVFAGPNYDNLLIPLTFSCLILVIDLNKKFQLPKAILLLSLLIAGCIIKFAFGPIAIGIGLYFGYGLLRQRPLKLSSPTNLKSIVLLISSFVLLIAVASLGAERYGGNLQRYGTLQPACQKVQSTQACLSYSVHNRNASYAQINAGQPRKSIVKYSLSDWYRNMVRGLVYPSSFFRLRWFIMAYCGLAIVAVAWRRQLSFMTHRGAWPLLAVCLFYVAVVFFDNYRTYLRVGEPFAINGRYLLPVLPILLVISHQNIVTWLHDRACYVLATAGWVALAIANLRLFV